MMRRLLASLTVFALLSLLSPALGLSDNSRAGANVTVNWEKVVRVSKTTLSVTVCTEPPMRRGSPIHHQLFQALHNLRANYARFNLWYPYPRLAVAELKPPHDGKTFWDFSLLDPIVADFMKANAGRPMVMGISTIPEWMFKTKAPVSYPTNPNQIDWQYEQGTELRDPSMKEVADYFARVASWYTQGGFKDEDGRWHASGLHYKFDYWEVLNEPDDEHYMTPQFYTALYDAIVAAVHRVDPQMKFVGLVLTPEGIKNPEYFDYFLNRKNHKPGIPLDMISYHFYAWPSAAGETIAEMEHTFFCQADGFITNVRYIESIRRRLSPQTRTYVDEVGTILPNSRSPKLVRPIPNSYWNLSGAVFAYVYAHLTELGINTVAEAELIDYPGQYAGTTLVDWRTGRPNARYWVLKLLRDNFGPGDKLVETQAPNPYMYAEAFTTPNGKHKILLINKRERSLEVTIPGSNGARVDYVDQTTGFEPPGTMTLRGGPLTLRGFAVAVVTLAK